MKQIAMTEGQREIAGGILVDQSMLIAYNLSFSLHVAGAISTPALEAALGQLVARHDVLRASFDLENAVLSVRPHGSFDFAEHDLGETDDEARREGIMRAAANMPFDFANGPLLRVLLIRRSSQRSEIVLIFHHIVCDGYSAGVLMRDLAALYTAASAALNNAASEARSPALPTPRGISELVAAEAAWQRSPRAARHRDFWIGKYSTSVPVMDLTCDKPRPVAPTTAAARIVTALDPALEASLRAFAAKAEVPLRIVIFSAFRYYLSLMAGSSDVAVGVPVAGQVGYGLDDAVAHAISFLPVRATIDRDARLRDLLRQSRRDLFEAVEHQNYTHGSLVRDLQMPRDFGRNVLTPVALNIDGLADLETIRFGTADARIEVNATGHQFFDLFFNQFDQQGRVELTWNYKTDLFDASTIELHAQNLVAFLRAIATVPEALDRPASRLIADAVSGVRPLPASGALEDGDANRGRTVTGIFSDIARQYANRVAVRYGDATLTYAELDRRANALAHLLVKNGVRPGGLVGISSQRSLSLPVAVLAVLKAGAGYVPFDISQPEERLRFFAHDTGIRLLLGDCPVVAATGVQVISPADFPLEPAAPLDAAVSGETIAYIMYTSGTTGMPKGAVLPHRSIVRLIADADWIEFSDQTVTLQSSAFAFDSSIIDLFAPLLNGGTLVVPPDGALSISDLADAVQSHGVNTLWLTSGLFHAIADMRPQTFANVRYVMTGGDVVSPGHAARVMDACPGVTIINGYGPTECGVLSNTHRITQADLASGMPLAIGRAVPGTQSYILDANLNPVPDGIIGELCISGRGLALGYWNRAELSAEKFIDANWDPALKLYRSGDLAMNPGNGVLRFFGRADTQVKIRGFRIELTEVEQALAAHPAIRQSVALAAVPQGQADKVLAVYFVAKGRAPQAAELRGFLSARLPEFSIPSFFVAVDEIPLNQNGKPDRAALPPLNGAMGETLDDSELRGDNEERLAEIWSSVLGIKVTAANANFFSMGGHSLLAVRLFDRIRNEFGHDLPISTLFANQTVRQLAALLETPAADATLADPDAEWDTSTIIHPGPEGGRESPLFIVGGVGGNVNNLMEIGALLGRRRAVVGFQTRGVQGHRPHEFIEDMAATNIRYMRKFQPRGPYLLAGYSGGALTASEMVRQLEANGETVERLFVLDTFAPGFARDFQPRVKLTFAERLADEYQLLREEGLSYFQERLFATLQVKIMHSPLRFVLRHASLSLYRYRVMQEIWMAAARKYSGGTFGAPVTLLRTYPRRLRDRRTLQLDPTLGWSAVSTHVAVDAPWVDGDHITMLTGDNALRIVGIIESRIANPDQGTTYSEMNESMAETSPRLWRSA